MLSLTKATVLAVTETWLDASLEMAVSVPGYNFVHKCRHYGKGGGVGFYIKCGISFEVIDSEWSNFNSCFECMFIKIHQTKCKDIIIGTLYRPPGNPVDQFNIAIQHTLSKMISTNHKIILAGDFNINLLKLAEHRPTHDFFNIMTSHQLLPSFYPASN